MRTPMPAVALTGAAALLITGCVPTAPAEDRTAELPDDTDTGVEEVADDEPEEEEGGSEEADLGGTYEFNDGLTVEMSNLHRGTSSEWALPESAPYVGWTLQLDNDTGSEVDTTLVHVECQVGDEGRSAEQVFDTDQGLGDGFTSTLMDGRQATAEFACEMAEDDSYLQVELSILDDFARPTIFFVGDVE